jgi:hypothetical protein
MKNKKAKKRKRDSLKHQYDRVVLELSLMEYDMHFAQQELELRRNPQEYVR